jgi:hypothetical protein
MPYLLLLLALTIPDTGAFKPLAQDNHVAVAIVRNGDQPPWVEATHELPVAAEKIYDLLADFDSYANVFAGSVKTARILDRKPDSARIHIVWPLPWPMKNRDAVVSYEAKKEAGLYRIDWVQNAQKGDPEEGLRIEHVMGRTVIEAKDATSSLVRYTYYGDLGGDLPDFIKEASYKEEPVVYFNAIRKKLALPGVASLP